MDTPFAITLGVGTSLANHTGSWRTERPVYRNGLPPCNDACPAGENIQGEASVHRGAGKQEQADDEEHEPGDHGHFDAVSSRGSTLSCGQDSFPQRLR